MKKKNKSSANGTLEKEESFLEKLKTDKRYSAKVQLIGYGILILVVIIFINFGNMTNVTPGNVIINAGDNSQEESVTALEKESLLKMVANNYSYDVLLEVKKKSIDNANEEDVAIRYTGKAYKNQVEINKEVSGTTTSYYKVDDLYYVKNDNTVNFVKEEVVYNVVDGDYLELGAILNLVNKASLDHVTDYSSGKKEYVYHLKVKDVIVSYKLEDVVEIEIEEENGVLKFEIDYTNLFRAIDDTYLECELEVTITDIEKVAAFDVLDGENTSIE